MARKLQAGDLVQSLPATPKVNYLLTTNVWLEYEDDYEEEVAKKTFSIPQHTMGTVVECRYDSAGNDYALVMFPMGTGWARTEKLEKVNTDESEKSQ